MDDIKVRYWRRVGKEGEAVTCDATLAAEWKATPDQVSTGTVTLTGADIAALACDKIPPMEGPFPRIRIHIP